MANALPIVDRTPGEARLRIGDLAKRSGKSARAVRLYEEKGLLGPALRTDGGHRLYAEEALERLGWIDKLQLLGLSLGEIKDFLSDLAQAETAPLAMARARSMFERKLKAVREQIASLASLEGELLSGVAYLASCQGCAPSTQVTACASCGQPHPVEPPPLVVGLRLSAEGKKS